MRLRGVLLAGAGALAMAGTSVATSGVAHAATYLYEAESPVNTLTGATVSACGTCLGGSMVGFAGGTGSLRFNGVAASAAGPATVTVSYAAATARQAQLSANDGAPETVSFAPTGGATVSGTLSLTVNLNAGNNTLTFSDTGGLAPAFDAVTVASGASASGADGGPAGDGPGDDGHGGGNGVVAGAGAAPASGGAGGAAERLEAGAAGARAPAAGGGTDGAGTAAAGAPAAGGTAAGDENAGGPSASDLLAKTANCKPVSNGSFDSEGDSGSAQVCAAAGAVFWTSGMAIDCDGQRSAQCNENTDCCFASATAFQQSDGRQLDSATLPYVVVPGASGTWNYANSGVQAGSVAAVIYQGKVAYAVVGDIGPTRMIGEGSYALAEQLGINPDARVGGAGSGVTFIVFTGPSAVARPIESHAAAVTLGEQLARQFVANN
ncbi:glycoside hydrolase family 75 protein [Rugosimonospora africana]|uniref:CBM6 domain-containing protein n=1 Tax=Rugosimonospora africana TaxID=556532 RepID=A0A8J3VWL6_9ACTN|nr:glycoside hydrolase family 75 protein [Rugosimonospora africana]GIH21054.1 hypothetical protein Raf01_92260 [Rugosimonospora africana]